MIRQSRMQLLRQRFARGWPADSERRCSAFIAWLVAALVMTLAWPAAASAQTTWLSNTAGGTWGTAGNWSAGAPTTTGTAVLGDATANRTVITAASGTVGTLSITQTTAGVLNELQFAYPFTVTNAVTLGAASGTARIFQMANSSTAASSTFSGGSSCTVSSVNHRYGPARVERSETRAGPYRPPV